MQFYAKLDDSKKMKDPPFSLRSGDLFIFKDNEVKEKDAGEGTTVAWNV